jgi:hypothetical protein
MNPDEALTADQAPAETPGQTAVATEPVAELTAEPAAETKETA